MYTNKIITLLFITAFFSLACLGQHEIYINQLSDDAQAYLKSFENAAEDGNKEKLLALMDDEYIRTQHDGFLEGRTDQFLKEFFCGKTTDGYECTEPEKIKKLKLQKIMQTQEGFDVTYKVITKDYKIEATWFVKIKSVNGKVIYGISGGVG
jgi:hypothetical protein